MRKSSLRRKAKEPFSETKMKERIRTETLFAADEEKKKRSPLKKDFFEKIKKINFFFIFFFQDMDDKEKPFFEEKILKTRKIIALETAMHMLENSEKDIVTINFDNSGIVFSHDKRKAAHISFL